MFKFYLLNLKKLFIFLIMKSLNKIVPFFIFIFSFNLFSQNNYDYLNDYLKELIVIETLIVENRVDELDKFLSEYGYIAAGEGSFLKFEFLSKKSIRLMFFITDGSDGSKPYLVATLEDKKKTNNEHSKIGNGIKSEVTNNWMMMLQEVTENLGTVWMMYKLQADAWEKKEVGGIEEDQYDDIYESINRYSFRTKSKLDPANSKWEVTKASNWSTWMTTEDRWIYSFHGPGKLDWLEFIFPKHNDKASHEEISSMFYIVPRTQYETGGEKDEINIDFFMALNNWNDRIWNDNK